MKTRNVLQQDITRFLQHLEGEQRSLLTVESYRQSLGLFSELSGLTDPANITKETIRKYKSDLAVMRTRTGEQLSVATRNKHLTILRRFLRYLVKEEERIVYPPDRITRLQEDERQVKFLNDEKVERLLAQPDDTTKIGRRDRAILELFYCTGLRLSELCSLNRGHIDLKTKEISVKGKRGKVRVVFISDEAAEAISQYLSIRFDHLDPLFIGRHDQARMAMPPGDEFRLSHRSVQRLVNKYARLAGLVDTPSPHTMRHSFASNLLRNGADLRSIQALLGHKNLSTTQIYTHVTDPMLKEVHQRFHRCQPPNAS